MDRIMPRYIFNQYKMLNLTWIIVIIGVTTAVTLTPDKVCNKCNETYYTKTAFTNIYNYFPNTKCYKSQIRYRDRLQCAASCAKLENCSYFDFRSNTKFSCVVCGNVFRPPVNLWQLSESSLDTVYVKNVVLDMIDKCPSIGSKMVQYSGKKGSCYVHKDLTDKWKYIKAYNYCNDLMPGMHLVYIETAEEFEVLTKFVDNPRLAVAVGGRKVSGRWIWNNGIELNYDRWAPGQPDGPEDTGLCLTLWRKCPTCSLRYDDNKCSFGSVMCEYNY